MAAVFQAEPDAGDDKTPLRSLPRLRRAATAPADAAMPSYETYQRYDQSEGLALATGRTCIKNSA
jgi:hypothetical protein